MMLSRNLFAHRGLWSSTVNQNSLSALVEAVKLGYGIETDLRDYKGTIVVSHDVAVSGCLSFETVLEALSELGGPVRLALNIKCDGIANKIETLMLDFSDVEFFCFDMSVPELVKYCKTTLPIYERVSIYEPRIIFENRTKGIWVDYFGCQWPDLKKLKVQISAGKALCFVSPELHGQPYIDEWSFLRRFLSELDPESRSLVSLCTDLPNMAMEYFNE